MHIICDASPEGTYGAMTEKKVIRLCEKYPMVNASFHRIGDNQIKITFRTFTKPPPSWTSLIWDRVLCDSITPSIKASPCQIGKSQKVFFRRAESLRDYNLKLRDNKISKNAHKQLFAVVLSFFPHDFINHNFDVRLLHFKDS
eukprot:48082-Eustigmatos_ZCMA.PRE.1